MRHLPHFCCVVLNILKKQSSSLIAEKSKYPVAYIYLLSNSNLVLIEK